MAAREVRIRQEGESLPDGAVHEGRGTWQLHDVTGKVQHARLIVVVQSARCASCRAGAQAVSCHAGGAHSKKKKC